MEAPIECIGSFIIYQRCYNINIHLNIFHTLTFVEKKNEFDYNISLLKLAGFTPKLFLEVLQNFKLLFRRN